MLLPLQGRNIGNFNFTARLPTVTAPTLVACGTEDPSATPAESRHIASLFPNGSYKDFSGARHLPNMEQPEAFNRVLGWLARGGNVLRESVQETST